jgi:hypothetical protein
MRAIGLVIAVAAVPAMAATIEVDPGSSEQEALVSITGQLRDGDADTFRDKIGTLPKATVIIHGPGGKLFAALKIGETIHDKGFSTFVAKQCSSACALAWLAGTPRLMASGAQIGFHAAFDAPSGQQSGMGNALLGAYLARLGLADEAVIAITVASPREMLWLSPAVAKQFNIAVTIADDPRTRLALGPAKTGPISIFSPHPPGAAEPPAQAVKTLNARTNIIETWKPFIGNQHPAPPAPGGNTYNRPIGLRPWP